MDQQRPQKPMPEPGQEQAGPGPGTGRWWLPIALAALLAFWLWQQYGADQDPSIPYTQFKKELAAGNVVRVEAKGETVRGAFKKPVALEPPQEGGKQAKGQEPQTTERFVTTLPPFGDDKLTEQLIEQGVTVVSKGSGEGTWWLVLLNVLPFLLLIGLFVLMARGARQHATRLFSV
ncbi:MAG: ATP-dependent metallopeptidase FtsH/Yme1/Tma family protein, partial [Planctomycetota bacterium]